jgi:hypothetical protein
MWLARRVEPKLARVGGFWDEPLLLPADPELVLQRTGYACMDENSYPPFSVFEENVWYFYDQTCGVETPDSPICHVTVFPNESCRDALVAHVGLVSATMRFTRVALRRGPRGGVQGRDDHDARRRQTSPS